MKHRIFIGLLGIASLSVARAELIIQPTNNNVAITADKGSVVPSDASVERLMQIFHITDMIDTAIAEQNKIATVMQTIPSNIPEEHKGIFARKQQQQLQGVLSKYSKVLGTEINNPNRRQQMIEAYKMAAKQNYTQADVNALIDFYQTPTGQQLLQKQNQVTLDYMQAVMPATIGTSAENLERIFPMLEKDVKKIFD